jgi:hypothetical protein
MEEDREREGSPEEEETESPPMSREEQELDKTRTFFLALEVSLDGALFLGFGFAVFFPFSFTSAMVLCQELQSLRPQLYQAADYCEHQYLFGDNKQG